MPGPGLYESPLKRSISTAKTVFQSRNSRFVENKNESPAVGQYHWQVIKQKVKSLKFGGEMPK